MAFTHTLTRAYRDSSGTSITSTETATAPFEINYDSTIPIATRTEVDYDATRANLVSLSIYCLEALTLFVEQPTALTVAGVTNTNAVDAQLNITAHGLVVGTPIRVTGIVGATNLNGFFYVKTVVDADHIKLSTTLGGSIVQGNGSSYTSGGSVYPELRIDLVANQNIMWSLAQNTLANCPFTTDVEKIFVTNANADTPVLKIRALSN